MDQGRPPKRPRKASADVIEDAAHPGPVGDANKKQNKKPPLSCAECRRLKLKCDRKFPCASCSKRGCGEICPDGALTSGKGSRFILANTEQLHTKIIEMADRIRQLEEALTVFQRERSPSQMHPLLAPELLLVKNTVNLYGMTGTLPSSSSTPIPDPSKAPMEDNISSSVLQGSSSHTLLPNNERYPDPMPIDPRIMQASSDDRRLPPLLDRQLPPLDSKPLILSQQSEQLRPSPSDKPLRLIQDHDSHHISSPSRELGRQEPPMVQIDQLVTDKPVDLSEDLVAMSRNLALLRATSPLEPDLDARQKIRDQLPAHHIAEHLHKQAKQNAFWQYNIHPDESFFPNLLRHVYHSSIETLQPQRMSILYMILAIGSLVDLSQPPDSPDGERYYHLARAALSEQPLANQANVDTITALFYLIWYLVVFSDKKKSTAEAWGLMGLTAKLAQSIGLHRDPGSSKMIPEEVDRRRVLYWELLHFDARLALSLGRPASLYLAHSDCKRPPYTPEAGYDVTEGLHLYQEWKHDSYLYYLSPVLELVSSPVEDYTKVLEVDKRVRRAYAPPRVNQEGSGPGMGGNVSDTRSKPSHVAMQQAMLTSAIETVYLQLHRTYFMRALSVPGPLNQHQYQPSVIAVFRSCCRLIDVADQLSLHERDMANRYLSFYSNAFAAAVALCLLVTRAPSTCLSPAALQQLRRTLKLLNLPRTSSERALQVAPILESMVDKACRTYNQWRDEQMSQPVQTSFADQGNTFELLKDTDPILKETLLEARKVAVEHGHPCLTHGLGPAVSSAAAHGADSPSTISSVASCGGISSGGNIHRRTPPMEYSAYQVSSDGRTLTPHLSMSTVNSSFRVPVVENLNWDFGAISTTTLKEDSWMTWF